MTFKPLDPDTLRAHKGKSFTGVATTFICHDGKGKIFMTQRGPGARDEQGTWDYGGGGLKFGASLEDNARREIKEEYGANVKHLEFLGYRDVFRAQDGIKTHWLAIDFAALIDPEQAHINEPETTSDAGWFTFGTLPSKLHSQVGPALKRYRPALEAIWQKETPA